MDIITKLFFYSQESNIVFIDDRQKHIYILGTGQYIY